MDFAVTFLLITYFFMIIGLFADGFVTYWGITYHDMEEANPPMVRMFQKYGLANGLIISRLVGVSVITICWFYWITRNVGTSSEIIVLGMSSLLIILQYIVIIWNIYLIASG